MLSSCVLDGLDDHGLEPVVAVQEPGAGDGLVVPVRSSDEEQLSISYRCAGVAAAKRPP